MVIDHLVLQNSVGSLFSIFQSNISISFAELANVTLNGMLVYMSTSRAVISSALLPGLVFNEIGSFGTLEQSELHLNGVTLRDLTSSVHGVLDLHQSSLFITACTVARLNMSLVTAEESVIYISDSLFTEIWVSFEGKSLSMLPSGGLISCLNCPLVYVVSSEFRGSSANEGGVIFAQHSSASAAGSVILDRCSFSNSTAKTNGGVMKVVDLQVTVTDCVFAGNTASAGGVVAFESAPQMLRVADTSFSRNRATTDGSCIRWVGNRPLIINSTFVNNFAVYGDPLASVPDHLGLLRPDSLQPLTDLPVVGVTGQVMKQPLVIGVFDVLDQLIVTDNSSIVTILLPESIQSSGSTEVLAHQGTAFFSLLFSPFSNATFNFTFYSAKSDVANLTFNYQFRNCTAGEISTPSGCFLCPTNSYSFNPLDSDCSLCPQHAQCLGVTDMRLDRGYWRLHNLTDDIYPCLAPAACLGGVNSDCAEGYLGTLCGGCESGYYQYGMWQCRACGDQIAEGGRIFIVSAFLISAVTVPPQLFLRSEGVLFKVGLLHRIVSNYAQTFLFVVLLHVQWPYTTLIHHEIWRAWGSLGHVLLYSGCQYPEANTFYFQVIAASLYPCAISLAALVVWSVVQVKARYKREEYVLVMASAGFIGVYNFLPLLSLVLVSMFQCTEVAGNRWLVADLSQLCWTGQHLAHIYRVAVPVFVLIVAIHVIAVCCICRKKTSGVFRYVQQYMRAGFKRRSRAWELRVLLRKWLLVCLSLAYPHLDKFSQVIFFVCIIGLSVHIEVMRLPYLSSWLNLLNVLMHAAVVSVVFTAVVGSEVEQTLVSALGSLLVIGVGLLTLKCQLSRKRNGAPVEGQDSQPASLNFSQASLLGPPPVTPAEVDINDIKLAEVA